MRICLFEDSEVFHFSPLTLTRGIYQLRTGGLTSLLRMWEVFERPDIILHTRPYLEEIVQSNTGLAVNELPAGQGTLFINGRIIHLDKALKQQLMHHATSPESQNAGRLFLQEDDVVAAWVPDTYDFRFSETLDASSFEGLIEEQVSGARMISRLWHLIDNLQDCLLEDLRMMLDHPASARPTLHPSITLINQEMIYISPDATIHPGAIISAADGPIFIDKGARVMESAIVNGPLYLGQNSVIKPRADVGKSAIGPVCKAGGEVKEVIMQSFSNKAHEGFLGHTYIGSWCNIGAGTNTSNLKNDYSETTLYNEMLGIYENTGRQFLGTIMADHSKIGISSMLNTATVIGVCCNLFGTGFMPRHLPSFSWGSPKTGFEAYRFDKASEAIQRVMDRRNRPLTDATLTNLEAIHSATHTRKVFVA